MTEKKIDDGGPAFPDQRDWSVAFPSDKLFQPGVTKRELFAAMAMQGMLANCLCDHSDKPAISTAKLSLEYSDALLAELRKGGEG